MSILKKLFGTAEEQPSDGFLVFDYNQMQSLYGEQAFQAISIGLRRSAGVCAFHDGDISSEAVLQLAGRAKHVYPSDKSSPLADLDSKRAFEAYLIGMWTDDATNFKIVHSHLCSQKTPGYVGCFTMAEPHEQLVFGLAMAQKLSLCDSIILRYGEVIPETRKYGVR